jgi:hypothetical protein
MSYSIAYFHSRVKAEIEIINSSCVCQENTGHAREGTEDSQKKDEGGTEWLN